MHSENNIDFTSRNGEEADYFTILVVSRINQPLSVLKGTGAAAQENSWIGLQLEGRGHRPLAGAVVTIEASGIPIR